MFRFPFGTMHTLNLDWFLQEWEIYKQEWADAQAAIDGALQGEIDRVEDAMTDLYNARDVAVQAKEDAQDAAASVVGDAAQCGADALKAEGFAVGEQDGIPVGSGSPYYQDNAKYYKVEAGTYRYLSEAYAKGEMGGSPVNPGEAGYQDNAKYYKDAADADAQQAHTDAQAIAANIDKAEGYAVGTQGGVPVSSGSPYYQNNAAYYAGECQQDKDDADHFKDAANQAALISEGFAVGEQNGTPVTSGSPYYENNAEYYMQQTLTALGSVTETIQIAGFLKNAFPTALAPLAKYQIVSTAGLTATGNTILHIVGNTGAWNSDVITGIKIPINTAVNILILPLKNTITGSGRIGYIVPVVDGVVQSTNRFDLQPSTGAGYINIPQDNSAERTLVVRVNGLNTQNTGDFDCQIIVEQSTGATRSLGLGLNPIDVKEIEDDNIKAVE